MHDKNTADSSSANKSSNILAEALSSTLVSHSIEQKGDNFAQNKIILDSLINDRSVLNSRKGSFATDNCHTNLRQNE